MRGLAWGTVLGLLIALGIVYFTPEPKKPITLQLKDYNIIILTQGEKVSTKGTHITSNGFCTQIWLGTKLDTNVCAPHLVTEAEAEKPTVEEDPGPTPKDSSLVVKDART